MCKVPIHTRENGIFASRPEAVECHTKVAVAGIMSPRLSNEGNLISAYDDAGTGSGPGITPAALSRMPAIL